MQIKYRHNKIIRRGFTLAEVLIMLVILGIVASLTISTMIKEYKKHVVASKLKAAYSILSNALNASIPKEGSLNFTVKEYGTEANGLAIIEKYLLPYLKVQSIEGKPIQESGYKKDILYPNGEIFASKTHKARVIKLINGMAIMYANSYITKNNGEKVFYKVLFM